MPFAGNGKTNFLLKENSFMGSHLHIKCFWRGKSIFSSEEFHSPDASNVNRNQFSTETQYAYLSNYSSQKKKKK